MASRDEINRIAYKEVRKCVFMSYKAARKSDVIPFEKRFHRRNEGMLPMPSQEPDILKVVSAEYEDTPRSVDQMIAKAGASFEAAHALAEYGTGNPASAPDTRYRIYLNANPFYFEEVLRAAKGLIGSSSHILFMKCHYQGPNDPNILRHLKSTTNFLSDELAHSIQSLIQSGRVSALLPPEKSQTMPIHPNIKSIDYLRFRTWLQNWFWQPHVDEKWVLREHPSSPLFLKTSQAETLLEAIKIVLYFDGDKEAVRAAVKQLHKLPKKWFGKHAAGFTRRLSKGIGFCKQKLTNNGFAESMGEHLSWKFSSTIFGELNAYRDSSDNLKKMTKVQLEDVAKRAYEKLEKEVLKEAHSL